MDVFRLSRGQHFVDVEGSWAAGDDPFRGVPALEGARDWDEVCDALEDWADVAEDDEENTVEVDPAEHTEWCLHWSSQWPVDPASFHRDWLSSMAPPWIDDSLPRGVLLPVSTLMPLRNPAISCGLSLSL